MADSTTRQATLKLLHDNDRNCVDRNGAIIMMAIRYGQARSLLGNPAFDYALVERARERRFAALMRLVYAR